ncbi:unnamed protein product [Rotaria sp. Silwood2]|nr:unnamed protein product [Rotaria sp. Silwood2]
MVISYLNSPDLVQAFIGLNFRFDTIVLQSTRQFYLPQNMSRKWFLTSMPHIENTIETLVLNTTSVANTFSCSHFFVNLRSVILRYDPPSIVELNVAHYSAIAAILSCLNALQLSKMLPPESIDKYSLFSSRAWIDEEEQADKVANCLPCPAIIRLSARVCTEQDLLCLCILAPNIIDLKIDSLKLSSIISNYSTFAAGISQPTRLRKLEIICIDSDDEDPDESYRSPFEILFKSYQSSLE